jgi:glutamate N-acetyltransferase/amino-acid N-acetyltransferase
MSSSSELSVRGFRIGGKKGGKYGVSIILSVDKASCSVMVTSNKIKAAPVELSMKHVKDNLAQGVVITSGNANAFTGEQGEKDANRICEILSNKYQIEKKDVIVNSTGIIGQKLDMNEIEAMIKEVGSNLKTDDSGITDAANAMRTTDSFEKISSRNLDIGGKKFQITGFAKGAGMIAPDLLHATMIAVILIDAYIPFDKIDEALKKAVEKSFNMINVDGDRSTNDMVILLANGKGSEIQIPPTLQTGLEEVCLDLAKKIVKDGEGATKFFEVEVNGAQSNDDARRAAKAISRSTLVKTAIFGENPNWGRVIAAIGYSGAEFNTSKLSLTLRNEVNEALLVKDGEGVALKGSEEIKLAGEILKGKEVTFKADLGVGDYSAVAFGCDLGYNYVKVNAEYTT